MLRYLGNYPKILCNPTYIAERTPSSVVFGWRLLVYLSNGKSRDNQIRCYYRLALSSGASALGAFLVAKDFVGIDIIGKDSEEKTVLAVLAEEGAETVEVGAKERVGLTNGEVQ